MSEEAELLREELGTAEAAHDLSLAAHVHLVGEQAGRITALREELGRQREEYRWLVDRHIGFVQAVGITTVLVPGMEIDVEDPIGMALKVCERFKNVEHYALDAYAALAMAEHVLQELAATESPLQEEALAAQTACIEVLQAAETF